MRTPTPELDAPNPPWLTIMTTAYCGFFDGAKEANQEVSSLEEPFGLRPKTCAVPDKFELVAASVGTNISYLNEILNDEIIIFEIIIK